MSRFKQSLFFGDRTCERSFDVTENMAFQKVGGQGPAVDDNKCRICPIAVEVNRPGDKFLSCSAFALYQNSAPGRCRGFDDLEDVVHHFTLADDLLETVLSFKLVLQSQVFILEPPVSDGPLHNKEEFIMFEGLLDIVIGPRFHRGDSRFDRCVSRDNDHDNLRIDLFKSL